MDAVCSILIQIREPSCKLQGLGEKKIYIYIYVYLGHARIYMKPISASTRLQACVALRSASHASENILWGFAELRQMVITIYIYNGGVLS